MKKSLICMLILLGSVCTFGQSSITVVTPNGGETWISGCPSQIQWISASTAGSVRIELYRNGVFYMVINPQVPATISSFTWMVPSGIISGNNYKVKITSLVNQSLFDFSDSDFSIIKGTITVTSPNGGENWEKGTSHPVTWNDNICENVRIELWKGNLFHMTIAQSVPSNGSFTWMIPNVPTLVPASDYRIKVMSLGGNSGTTNLVFDYSDSLFTISAPSAPAGIALIAPNGGEQWTAGCQATIQWATTLAVMQPVRLELFRNNAFYMLICPQTTANLNSFTWMVPWSVLPGNDYKVKVSTLTTPVISDMSDAPFTIIRGSITVLSPNGGENWVKGTMHPILWNDNLCGNVRIELWKGNAYHSLVASNIPSNGTFNWTIPTSPNLLPGDNYRIKILGSGNSTATSSIVFDYSDSVFTISQGNTTGSVAVVSPNGGEVWTMGCPNNISWTSTSTTIGPVKVELFRNNLFVMTIKAQVPAGVTTLSWIAPWSLTPAGNYRVKVTSLSNPNIFDFSDADFSIQHGAITVISPNGGEQWLKGTAHTILWNDNICDQVRIELWKGTVFHSVIAPSVPSNGNFMWLIPNVNSLVPGNDYRVKIRALAPATGSNMMVSDMSDSTFSILGMLNNAINDPLAISQVYPNPCSHRAWFEFSGSSENPVLISIYDKLGNLMQKIESSRIEPGKCVEVNTSGLNPGTYIYVVTCSGRVIGRGPVVIAHR